MASAVAVGHCVYSS